MKSFIVSLVLLFGIIAGVTLLSLRNLRAVGNFQNDLITFTDCYLFLSDEEARNRFFTIVETWKEESPRLAYSVNRRELADIDAVIYEAIGAQEGGDKALFLSAMRTLEARIQELYELVGVHIENIT